MEAGEKIRLSSESVKEGGTINTVAHVGAQLPVPNDQLSN